MCASFATLASFFINLSLLWPPEGIWMWIMQGTQPRARYGSLVLILALTFCAFSARANPTSEGPGPIYEPKTLAAIFGAIGLEAACVALWLRKWRTPRFFVLWLMAMHLLTYPVFLGLLWLAVNMKPGMAVVTGEAIIVLLEGALIFSLCRWLPSRKEALPSPSAFKTVTASLAGNICSFVAFPLISTAIMMIARSLNRFGTD